MNRWHADFLTDAAPQTLIAHAACHKLPFPRVCQGFGFLGFIVDDLDGASKCLEEKGATGIPEPDIFAGKLRRFADPDGYHVQLALRKAVLE